MNQPRHAQARHHNPDPARPEPEAARRTSTSPASDVTTIGTTAMNTSTIAEAHRARRRRYDDNTGPRHDAHEPPTSVPRAADDPGVAPLPLDHRDRQRGYRASPCHLPTTQLTITGRILTPDLPVDATEARHQRDATADLDKFRPEPNPSTGHSLNLAVGAGRGQIEVRHRRSPT